MDAKIIGGLIVVCFALLGVTAFYPYYVGTDRCQSGSVYGTWENLTETKYYNSEFPAIARYFCDIETDMSRSDCLAVDKLLNPSGCKWGGKTSASKKTLYVMEDPPLETDKIKEWLGNDTSGNWKIRKASATEAEAVKYNKLTFYDYLYLNSTHYVFKDVSGVVDQQEYSFISGSSNDTSKQTKLVPTGIVFSTSTDKNYKYLNADISYTTGKARVSVKLNSTSYWIDGNFSDGDSKTYYTMMFEEEIRSEKSKYVSADVSLKECKKVGNQTVCYYGDEKGGIVVDPGGEFIDKFDCLDILLNESNHNVGMYDKAYSVYYYNATCGDMNGLNRTDFINISGAYDLDGTESFLVNYDGEIEEYNETVVQWYNDTCNKTVMDGGKNVSVNYTCAKRNNTYQLINRTKWIELNEFSDANGTRNFRYKVEANMNHPGSVDHEVCIDAAETVCYPEYAVWSAGSGTLEDNFNRANNVTLGTASNGNVWVDTDGDYGKYEIQTNRMWGDKTGSSGAQPWAYLNVTNSDPEHIDIDVNYTNVGVTQMYLLAGDGDITNAANMAFYCQYDGSGSTDFECYSGSWVSMNFTAVANTIYTYSFRNLNYTSDTYDFYVDNVLRKTGAAFRNNNAITRVGSTMIAGADFYYDNLCTNGGCPSADPVSPVVTAVGPVNNTITSNYSINFSFYASDDVASTLDCDLYLNGTIKATDAAVANNTNTTLQLNVTAGDLGLNTWNVSCSDGTNTNTSENRVITLAGNCTSARSIGAVTHNASASMYWWDSFFMASTPSCSNTGVGGCLAQNCSADVLQINFTDETTNRNLSNVTVENILFVDSLPDYNCTLSSIANGTSDSLCNITGIRIGNNTPRLSSWHLTFLTGDVNSSEVTFTGYQWKVTYDCRDQTTTGTELTDSWRQIEYINYSNRVQSIRNATCDGTTTDLPTGTICRYGINSTVWDLNSSEFNCYDVP